MYAQDATAGGLTTGTSEDPGRCTERAVQNGVLPQTGPTVNPAWDNPNEYDPAPTTTAAEFLGRTEPVLTEPDVVEPAYGAAPDMEARTISDQVLPRPTTPVPMSSAASPPSSSTVRVQEFYTAESRAERQDQGGFRWMTRFTEFLRTTATRSASNMDRMLDNLGFPHLQPTATTNQMQQYGSLNISPPQDLQPGVVVPAVPTSWSTIRGTQPLFTEAQVSQMRQAQREHPQIYGPTSDGGSDRSSRLQAEVQKQMEEYMQKHQSEIARLQREVRDLRQEKQLLLQGGPASVPAASSAPQGNVQQLPQSGPASVPAASGIPQGNVQQLPQSGPVSVPAASGIPQGNVQQLPQSGPASVPAASSAPQGNVQQLPQSGPVSTCSFRNSSRECSAATSEWSC